MPQDLEGSPPAPEDARAKLVQAVIALLPERGAADLSVRDIARTAGVNHGLVHRHFGSKEALFREALATVAAGAHHDHPGVGLSAYSWGLLREHPELARILARMCLDGPHDLLPLAGPPEARLERYVEPVRRFLATVGLSEQVDPYLLNALGAAALLGWTVFRPLLDAGWKVPADADAQVERLAALLDTLLPEPPSAEGGGGGNTRAVDAPSP